MVKACAVRSALCAGILFLMARGAVAQDDVIGIPVGQTPPAVTLQNLNGDSVSLSQWIGKKPVIVEFWATWCPICAELLPRMEAAHNKYGTRAEFLVVAVAGNGGQKNGRRQLERQPQAFTVLLGGNRAAGTTL